MNDKGNGAGEKLWTRDYVVVMLASTGISFCNYFFFSTLPIYARMMTGTTAYSGLMMGLYTFAALLIRPAAGIMADRFGRTRLIIAGAAICTLACGLYAVPGTLAMLLCLRALHGIGFGIHSTTGGVIAADIIPKRRMAEGLGYFGIYGTLAAAVAPGAALAIIGPAGTGFNRLFAIAAATSCISLALDCLITYERGRKRAAQPAMPAAPAPATLPPTIMGFEYAAFMPGLVVVLMYIALSSVVAFLPLYALERHMGGVGLFFTINAAGLFLSRVLLGKTTDRYGADRVVPPALALLAVCLALVPAAGSAAELLWLAFPMGIAQGAIGPAINTLIFARCSVQRRGTASAAYASSIDIGYSAGSTLFGVAAAGAGFTAVYLASAAFTLAAFAIYIKAVAGRRPRMAVRELGDGY